MLRFLTSLCLLSLIGSRWSLTVNIEITCSYNPQYFFHDLALCKYVSSTCDTVMWTVMWHGHVVALSCGTVMWHGHVAWSCGMVMWHGHVAGLYCTVIVTHVQ